MTRRTDLEQRRFLKRRVRSDVQITETTKKNSKMSFCVPMKSKEQIEKEIGNRNWSNLLLSDSVLIDSSLRSHSETVQEPDAVRLYRLTHSQRTGFYYCKNVHKSFPPTNIIAKPHI